MIQIQEQHMKVGCLVFLFLLLPVAAKAKLPSKVERVTSKGLVDFSGKWNRKVRQMGIKQALQSAVKMEVLRFVSKESLSIPFEKMRVLFTTQTMQFIYGYRVLGETVGSSDYSITLKVFLLAPRLKKKIRELNQEQK